ncbi:hypothetical protein D3C87_324590 [compost metagenome]
MKTYFIAGHSDFPGTGERWEFWRVMNINDKKTPQDLIEEVCKELENNPMNYKDSFPGVIRGEVTITAFNQV